MFNRFEELEGRWLLAGWTITDLGLSPTHDSLIGMGLNNSGMAVAGTYGTKPVAALRDSAGKVHALPLPVAGIATGANDVNEGGNAVGFSDNYSLVLGARYRALYWHAGTVTELVGPGRAVAINDSGLIVGDSWNGSSNDAAVWQNGGVKLLGTFGGNGSEALDVNNAGQIVGDAAVAGNASHAFLYSGGKMTDLGLLPGGKMSSALAINEAGQIVGASISGDSTVTRAVIWSGGGMKSLGTIAGDTFSIAKDINQAGAVVGLSAAGDLEHPFIWTAAGGMVDLNSYFPGAGFHLVDALNINDKGQILAYGQTAADKVFRTYVLSPPGVTPPPGTVSPTVPPVTTPPPPVTPVVIIPTSYGAVDLKLNDGSRINGAGMVASVRNTATGTVAVMSDSAGRVTPLGVLGGDVSSFATDIDEANELVGDSVSGGDQTHRAFFWHGGKMSELIHNAGDDSRATAMNDKGAIVGSITPQGGESMGTVWANKTVKSLGTLGGNHSVASDINNGGIIVGESNGVAGGRELPFYYSNGKMTALPLLANGNSGSAAAINDLGDVVGGSADAGAKFKAVLWSAKRVISLGTLPGDDTSVAKDINSSGLVVGVSSRGVANPRAFVWSASGKMVDLNSYLSNSSFAVVDATSINDEGQIVVIGRNSAGIQHVFLLTPSAGTVSKPAVVVASSSAIRKPGAVLGSAGDGVLG